MDRVIKIFPTPQALAEALAFELVNQIKNTSANNLPFTIALSGGNTPKLLFLVLGDKFATLVNWHNVHIFWVDERCVPADDPESNFGMTKKALLDKIDIPEYNVHRIKGEENPEAEAERYSKEIEKYTKKRNGFPIFDVMLLGLGEDGHTASLFPGKIELFMSEKIIKTAIHPVSGQKRITLTGKVINNSKNIYFLVTGKNKAQMVKSILCTETQGKQFPAFYVLPEDGGLIWYLDNDAGSLTEERGVKK